MFASTEPGCKCASAIYRIYPKSTLKRSRGLAVSGVVCREKSNTNGSPEGQVPGSGVNSVEFSQRR